MAKILSVLLALVFCASPLFCDEAADRKREIEKLKREAAQKEQELKKYREQEKKISKEISALRTAKKPSRVRHYLCGAKFAFYRG